MDGCIAGPGGEYDWITEDPSIDFAALLREFDTLLMGRKTFDVLRAQGPGGPFQEKKIIVVSKTLHAESHADVTIIRENVVDAVAKLKNQAGKDIWLFGGGQLFRTLLDAQLVDSIEIAVMPILLGGGIALLTPGDRSPQLKLVSCTQMPSGIVMLAYEIPRPIR